MLLTVVFIGDPIVLIPLADVAEALTLLFGYASCEKSGTDTRRVFEELSDVTSRLDRILMETQSILDRTRRLVKVSSRFAHRALGEFGV